MPLILTDDCYFLLRSCPNFSDLSYERVFEKFYNAGVTHLKREYAKGIKSSGLNGCTCWVKTKL